MLERYFIRPETVDRIRACWLGDAIETYVAWLTGQSYSTRCVVRRVPLFMQFGEFARKRGVTRVEELHRHLDAFVRSYLHRRVRPCGSRVAQDRYLQDIRRPIEQFLRVVQTGHLPCQPPSRPFPGWAPHFFDYLRQEAGLSPITIAGYSFQLARFEQYVVKRRLSVDRLSPAILDGFLAEQRVHLSARSLGMTCAALRRFLRYLFQEGTLRRDLSASVDRPRTYSLSEIPRSISAADVDRTLAAIDRRSIVGRRDYAMLLLLAVYGLRAREVATLTLDDLDWRSAVLHVRGRKAGHTGTYPLTPEVGEAMLDYLRHGRPETPDRRIFFHINAPHAAVTHGAVSLRAMTYLRKAGITVSRPGSHTLRHSCAQRLVDADFSLKVIGDFLGHRHPMSTRVYSKVAIEALREVALGDGEVLL
ncbi:MAG: integrase [Nitrospirae bacterium]|nr:MAG: integrase [Nitrospirota bacterium]